MTLNKLVDFTPIPHIFVRWGQPVFLDDVHKNSKKPVTVVATGFLFGYGVGFKSATFEL